MKLIASILITVALSFGALTAAIAYTVPADAPDEALIGKTLRFDAGKLDGRKKVVIVAAGTVLTPDDLAQLRDAGVTQVDVKEFEFGLWRGKWIFVASLGGLLVGALMLRQDAAKRVKRVEETHAQASPAESLDAVIADVRKVRDRIVNLQGHDRCHAIIEGLDEAERTHMPAFVDSRERLIARHGLAGFAKIMDRFAAAERQVHRAWSLAADGVELDAVDCLERADAMLDETRAML